MNSKVKKETLVSKKEFNKDQIIIRNYRTSDYEATLEILRQLHDIYDIGLKESQWRPTSGLRLFKPNMKRITLIAEQKSTNEVLGMGMLEASKNTIGQYIGYMEHWAIRKEYIGMNVGKLLADEAIRILRSWGCELIRINLGYKPPERLLKVFGRSGFTPIMVVMEKRFKDNH